MDDDAPVHVKSQVPAGRHTGERSGEVRQPAKRKMSRMKFVIPSIIATVVLIFVIAGGLFLYQATMGANIDSGKYQAVFLDNGQVYFGKLQALNGGYMKLTDIYYLQAKSASTSNPQATSDQANTDVQLIKLGKEIHGPDDEMIISRDKVLFFENLQTTGKVAQSIASYQKQKK